MNDVGLAKYPLRALFNISPKLNYPLSRVQEAGCLLGGIGLGLGLWMQGRDDDFLGEVISG